MKKEAGNTERLSIEVLNNVLDVMGTIEKCCGGIDDSLEIAKYEFLKKLKEYMDLEEQGKLLKLPCAVGDRIYVIDTDERVPNKEIADYDIDNIVIRKDGDILLKYDAYDGVICRLENITTDKPYLDFYRCFLTREEAESALKEL